MERFKWFYILVFGLPCASHASAQSLEQVDQTAAMTAIEDYRFGDADVAIRTLERLYKKYPDNLQVARYLAASYEDLNQYPQAIAVYQHWMKAHAKDMNGNTRVMWLAQAQLTQKSGDYAQGIDVLHQWLGHAPDDLEARSILGDLLVRNKAYDEADDTWSTLLKEAGDDTDLQASANYYKALIAYSQGDLAGTQAYANAAIQAQPDGSFAGPARQLLAAKSAQKSGMTAQVAMEEIYTSNVALLPDLVTPASGAKKSDYFLRTSMGLGYRSATGSLGYSYIGEWHALHREYDMLIHTLYGGIRKNSLFINPKFQYVMLGGSYLYSAYGAEFGWQNDSWRVAYDGLYKNFNKTYSSSGTITDLTRLGGYAQTLSAMRFWTSDQSTVYLGLDLMDEMTKGDTTHPKTDSYRQAGSTLGVTRRFGDWFLSGHARAYYRKYSRADTTILSVPASALARSDQYMQLATSIGFNPDKEGHHQLIFNASWQRNRSNYNPTQVASTNSKEYSEWRAGLGWSYQW